MSRQLLLARRGAYRGEIRPPSDKSLTHRALLFAAMAKPGSDSTIKNPLTGEDCLATRSCMNAMGALEVREEGMVWRVRSGPWRQAAGPLDCGNSGTTMRLLTGILAPRVGLESTLIGDESLSRRPMKRVAEPLRQMGADIEGDKAPLTIRGASLHGIDYHSPVPSAQVKSAILLAGLRAQGTTRVTEPSLSRDHSERMLGALGVTIKRSGLTVEVEACEEWGGLEIAVPGDISSSAFLLAAAAGSPGSEIVLKGVGVNPTRSGVLDVLEQAGVAISLSGSGTELGEPYADVSFTAPKGLKPFCIGGDLVPRLIDEIPVLAVLATQCHGVTVIKDAAELRVKETDRLAVVSETLLRMGAKVEVKEDGMIIEGPTPLKATRVDAKGDHRIAMSFAIAAGWAEGETVIDGAESIDTSYPSFMEHINALSE